MGRTRTIALQFNMSSERVFFLITFLLFIWRPGLVGSETLTLTTYYPAPYGGYVSLLSTQTSYFARDGGGVTIGGSTAPTTKLDVRGGGISIDGNQTISSRGRMNIDGTEILYVLNRNGAIISRDWGGAGTLEVEGALTVDSRVFGLCITKSFGDTGTTSCPATHPMLVGSFHDSGYYSTESINDASVADPSGGSHTYYTVAKQRNGRFLYDYLGSGWTGWMTCCNMDLPLQ